MLFLCGDFDVTVQTEVLNFEGAQIWGAFALSFTQTIAAPVNEALPCVSAYGLAVLTFTVLCPCCVSGQGTQWSVPSIISK